MKTDPPTAQCRTVLADGTFATLTASRRPRGNRADVKCSVPGAAALAEHMQAVIRAARLTEAVYDSRDQVVISMDRAPAATERDWELGAVLADRMVRGIFTLRGTPLANGWSEHWHLGRIDGCAQARAAEPGHLLGGAGGVPHLGVLHGQPDRAAAVSTARTWFPLYSGRAEDALAWVEVSVHPLDQASADEEDTIAVPGADAALLLAVRRSLAAARHFDARGTGRWRTVVRFSESRFQGPSYELALVLADRLARGREFSARGRVIASGCSQAWHAGRVDSVDGTEPKAALILKHAASGDRILLPRDWETALGERFRTDLRQRGASAAFIDRIGII
jgi:hypothetical protein